MASRFWVAQPVSGAIVSPTSPPQVRLTVSSTTGMTTGDVRTVFGIVGTTEANGTWTITVIDGTHIDLQGTTFSNLYTSGGAVNGKWDSSNTNNWSATSGGAGGQSVPGSGDTVTLDGSSGGGTVTVNTSPTITSLTFGAFTGTLDFSANNNNITTGSVVGAGTGTRTLNMGNGTWTVTGIGTAWDYATTTNLTHASNSSTLTFTGTSNQLTTNLGNKTFNTINLPANSSGFSTSLAHVGATIATLNITAPLNINFTPSQTLTITNAFNWVGSAFNNGFNIYANSASSAGVISIASGSSTMSWAGIRLMTFTGGATFTATNSFDQKGNTGITITGPSGNKGVFGS